MSASTRLSLAPGFFLKTRPYSRSKKLIGREPTYANTNAHMKGSQMSINIPNHANSFAGARNSMANTKMAAAVKKAYIDF